jgi:hypothetical protein
MSFYIFGYSHEPCIEKAWRFLLNFDRVLAIENLKKHLIFSTFNFYYSFLAIFGEQKTMLTLYPCVHGMDGWIDGGRASPADSRG